MVEKSNCPKGIMLINILLLAIALVIDVIWFPQTDQLFLVLSSVTHILVLLACFYYWYMGYKKEGQVFYKLFMYLYAIHLIFNILFIVSLELNVPNTVANLLSYGAVCILSVGKDLGKKKSYVLGGIVVLSQLAVVITVSTIGINAVVVLPELLLSIVLMMVIGVKYIDKTARGTK